MSKKFSKTSHEAYQEAKKELIEKHKEQILAALKKIRQGNYEQIASKAGLEKHQVGRRLSELSPKKIIRTGKTIKTESGHNSCVYKLV